MRSVLCSALTGGVHRSIPPFASVKPMSSSDLLTFVDLRGRDPGSLPDTYTPPSPEAVAATAEIIGDVRRRGDDALRELGERFDGAAPANLAVPLEERQAALASIDEAARRALTEAHGRILGFHRRSSAETQPSAAAAPATRVPPSGLDCCDPQPPPQPAQPAQPASNLGAASRPDADGLDVQRVVVPVRRAGLYVPGGRAAYPSTVLMTAAPARAAGVTEIALCVPPGADGRVAAITLAATAIAGVDEVYAVGGAGAIAAMAYGTETIPAVDVIAGPGNVYVALAKQMVAGEVGVAAAFTGPSEVVVVADESVRPELAALDLIVQAEHGPDGMTCLLTWDIDVLRAVSAAVAAETAKAARRGEITETLKSAGYAVLVSGPEQAAEVVNHVAPEHLQLMLADPGAVLAGVRNAGAVFCGEHSPASLGDYVAGPSHVLPTGRSARYAEALGVRDFYKEMHVITASAQGLRRLGPIVESLAAAEGLSAHAESVHRRLELLDDAEAEAETLAWAPGQAPQPDPPTAAALPPGQAPQHGPQPAAARPPQAPQPDPQPAAAQHAADPQPAARRLPPGIRPAPRGNIAAMVGYHSPQVDVAVRLNTNESPFKPPQELRRRLAEAAGGIDWNRYPSRSAHELRERIAALHSLSVSQVFAGKGSNEVIQSLCLAYGGAGRQVAVFSPTYALHSHISRITGAEVLECPRDDDFAVAPEVAASFIIENRPSMVFLCSPNNPTGGLERPETIEAALRATISVGGLLVVDEAYRQFTDPGSGAGGGAAGGAGAPTPADRVGFDPGLGSAPDAVGNSVATPGAGAGGAGAAPDGHPSSLEVSEEYPLVVTRTFSKYWTLAGARLGYALGPSWIIEEMEKATLPYHLDAFTQQAGSIVLDYEGELAEAAKALVGERERIAAGLHDLPVRQWPSAANFILFRPEGRSGDDVWRALLTHSVLVRNCSSWPDLQDCLRVTVGTQAENDAFLSALTAVLR